MSTFSNLVGLTLDKALTYNVSEGNPILLEVKNDLGASCLVCVSHEEPYNYTIPTNALWLLSDEARQDYGYLRRRIGKEASAFNHSWQEVTSLEGMFDEPDVWANSDLPLIKVMLDSLTDHANMVANDDPHGLKSYTDGRTASLGTSFGAAFTNLNQRVVKAQNDISGILALNLGEVISTIQQVDQDQNQEISTLKNRTSLVEASQEGRPGIPKHVHVQEVPEESWVMEHYLDGTRFMSEFFNAEGEPLYPASFEAVSNNTITYFFAVPVAGSAVILKV